MLETLGMTGLAEVSTMADGSDRLGSHFWSSIFLKLNDERKKLRNSSLSI